MEERDENFPRLQDEEFIQVVRFLMPVSYCCLSASWHSRPQTEARLDYYPHHILKHLNLLAGLGFRIQICYW